MINATNFRKRTHCAIGRSIVAAGALLLLGARSGSAQALGLFQGQTDVGITPKPGSVLPNTAQDAYTVTGGGGNMWGAVDAFHFVWRRWTGDVTLSANVKILTPSGNTHRKAGLMIRQGLGPDDAFADALLHASGLMALQYRTTQGATTLSIATQASSPPTIRLERRGDTFTLFVAEAGGAFKQIGSAEIELHDPVYVGLAVCSHDANALTTAQFTDVQISATGLDAPMKVPRVRR